MVNPGTGCIVHRNVENRCAGNDAPYRALHGNGFWSQGINWGPFSLNLLMLPVIGIGALLGIRMVKLFPEKAFRRFIQFVTILSVAMMLV